MTFTRENIRDAKITVMGAARSGLDAALLLQKEGASVFLSELNNRNEMQAAAELLDSRHIAHEFGGHTDRIFEADILVLSPGIPVSHYLVREALSKKIEVLGELEVASWFCKGRIAAITGSNGKSTTTALLGEMVKQAGIPGVVAGNIGTTFSSQVPNTRDESVAVVEVSNFQLETIRDFAPHTAVFLNLTPDHLDRHGTVTEYARIKSRIFENQTADQFAVYNRQDDKVNAMIRTVDSMPVPFQWEDPGEDGAFVKDNRLTVRWKDQLFPLCPVSEMGIPGPHNVMNGLAAAMAAVCLDLPVNAIQQALSTFKGLPHRMETVRELNRVLYYNDSKSTNVDSMACALKSFPAPVILIAGGRDKASDFTVLNRLIRENAKRVLLIGEAADKMENAWKNETAVVRAASLQDAVEKARQSAETGDVVLLSPGCASFDMFENFEDRGNQFKSLVNAL